MSNRSLNGLLSVATLGVLASVAALAPCAAVAHTAAPATTMNKDRVVMQVSDNDPGKWNLALNNAHNLQQALGAKNIDIEIVAYGPGIHMLTADSVVGNRIGEAAETGVQIVACQVTMKSLKLTKNDMLDKVGYVPGGVIEIMHREQQGWAYIRP